MPRISFLICALGLLASNSTTAQTASISESADQIKTYPYSDPNPIPVLGINKKVAPFYPYFVFDGYTDKASSRPWKVVKLENNFITVTVLPEVGGKVMGAVENGSGNEFVYLNHVMKFRAIGIRGPWTSGGIEHNFGLDLGHAPWAASPVDYVLITNPDSSVSCIVGGLDLASRSEWRVNIRLPKDKAFFETESMWYNTTPLHHAYLSWENAAFRAADDLQFYFPGNHHIGHDGLASPWPIDSAGRNLSMYKANNFGDSKSYHVVGNYRNFFGGYWHDKNFGFGHWAPYADAPGKKLWIWSLSREGAIWENLLTDKDGQYIEAQSGVKLNQAAERSGFHSPFTQLSLRPLYTETKREYWFPVKRTGGLADATPYGTLNVTMLNDSLQLAINPTAALSDSLLVTAGDKVLYRTFVQMQPMEVLQKTIPLQESNRSNIRVSVGSDKLLYTSNPQENEVSRPIIADAADQPRASAQRMFRLGEEENAMRNYTLALNYYQQCLAIEPAHHEALCRVAEYYYRGADYEKGLPYALKVLSEDTYDGGANYIYGALLRALGKLPQAEEAFSIAARTMEYRSASYVALAGLNLQQQRFRLAASNAALALNYNKNNLLAYELLASALRKMQQQQACDSILQVLLHIDPLNHYAHFEQYLLHPSQAQLQVFKGAITNELPHETYLELAVTYASQGLVEEAIAVLEQAPAYPTVYYWLAYLTRNSDAAASQAYLQKAEQHSPRFVFPFRQETIPVLAWAKDKHASWKTNYYLALVYWNNLRTQEAKELMEACGDEPDFAPFYLARAALFQEDSTRGSYLAKNYERAVQLESGEWRTWHYRNIQVLAEGKFQQELPWAKQAYARFTSNPVIAVDYAKALLNAEQYAACLAVLDKVLILPQEGAQEGHEIYEQANILQALQLMGKKQFAQALKYLAASRLWPEKLGTGSPYNPDNRLQDVLSAFCAQKLGKAGQANDYKQRLMAYSLHPDYWTGARNQLNNYLSMRALAQENQTELKRLVIGWKAGQDSLSAWGISAGSSMPEVQWVLAKYNGNTEKSGMLEKEMLAAVTLNYSKLFLKAMAVTGQ